MSCTVVIGGQYGSEGKGKIAALLAAGSSHPWVVRCGGPNSGHSVWSEGQQFIFQQLPTAALHPTSTVLLAAGCAIDESILIREVRAAGLPQNRVIVDPCAVLIAESDREEELRDIASIGSTASGTNHALIRRMRRRSDVGLAASSNELHRNVRIESVAPLLHRCLRDGRDVIVEGTQGFGLSLLHGAAYPYATARETSASAFCSEVGLSPRHVDRIVMVIRTFPIRVGGTSGPLPNEIDWGEVRRLSGAPQDEPEFTSVSHRVRRVAHFEVGAVRRACAYNDPTSLAVMGLDRLHYADRNITDAARLSSPALEFIARLERETGVPVDWVGTGFRTTDAIRMGPTVEKCDYAAALKLWPATSNV
jgi:adenylosuccinate synthase